MITSFVLAKTIKLKKNNILKISELNNLVDLNIHNKSIVRQKGDNLHVIYDN